MRGLVAGGKPFCIIATAVLFAVLLSVGCSRSKDRVARHTAEREAPSPVSVTVNPGGPVVIRTTSAEFDVLPSGYVKAYLLKNGSKLTLDDPLPGATGNHLSSGSNETQFTLDFAETKVTTPQGKIGRGKRVEIPAKPSAPWASGLQETFAIEVFDDFPNIALTTQDYKNTGSKDVTLDQVVTQAHRLNAGSSPASTTANATPASAAKTQPFDMWSFQGSSYEWGKDDVIHLRKNFSQPNLMGAQLKNGLGGGIPVVAFWNASVGEAVGHVETLPLVLSLPVKVAKDDRVNTEVDLAPKVTLKPGDSYSTPRTFVSVYAGDFYEPLHLYASVLAREGWILPKPSKEAYNIAWCGWGYEFNVTPKKMLGTIPKLKEMNIKWATLDDRWFQNYGDWEPRPDTFPGNSIKTMVDEFHKQRIYAQIWWLPLGVEDGQGKWPSHHYGLANVVKQHPDWLILDKNGKHARMVRDLAVLDPSLPEVQDYYKKVTEKFIRDWGFDGHKLDNIYTVPACYNPKHHHKSPQESINALADVYRIIYQTTRALKPESVTQSCPCGTPPSLAWLPYMDQAVTADPVGSVQVRRRIKMYKALLGPEAAIYGDHVELTKIAGVNSKRELDMGRDFASTIGTGGVVGTKFVWPDPGAHFEPVNLTREKEDYWKKWTDIYNQKMLSKGTFRNLYVQGYDIPEGYAIEKDGKMYYAFFAPSAKPWKGKIELRGLGAGKYRIIDYANGRDLGTMVVENGKTLKLTTEFKDDLLLEVSK